MNNLFCRFGAFLLLCVWALPALSAKNDVPRPVRDSLPPLDSLAEGALRQLGSGLTQQAFDLRLVFTQKVLAANARRDSMEQALAAAKLDSASTKESLKSMGFALKEVQKNEKIAQQQQKQAEKTADLASKMAEMDSAGLRKNLPKLDRQIQELQGLLRPPAPNIEKEKPIAEIIGSVAVNDPAAVPAQTADSLANDTASVKKQTAKKTRKPKKSDAPPLKIIKTYDAATDVMLHPPTPPCALTVNRKDEFSGGTYQEVRKAELFRYTNEVMKKVLRGKPHIICDAALASTNTTGTLNLTFTINDPNARRAFGSLPKGGVAVLKFMDGETISLFNLRQDDGALEPANQTAVYRGQYVVDRLQMKKMQKTELDKIRIAWSTGYEDYNVHSVDLLQHQADCLLK